MLDTGSIDGLIEQVRSAGKTGVQEVSINCEAFTGALWEAVDRLAMLDRLCHDERLPHGMRLNLIQIPQRFGLMLQLHGYGLESRGLSFPTGRDLAAAAGARSTEAAGTATGVCPRCETGLHFGPPGLYACPECGVHLHIDERGRVVEYESLSARELR